MDVQKYLERIGISKRPRPDRESLAGLIRAHLETVPFENLDFYETAQEVFLDPERLYEKIVKRRRGGICFELNGLFAELLRKLGYQLTLVGARIQWHYDCIRPLSHQGILVSLPEGRFYCDVGFGGPGPKGLLSLDETGPQEVCGEWFLVRKRRGPGSLDTFWICRKEDGEWREVIVFADLPVPEEDFRILCYYYTHSPESKFRQGRVVNLCLPNGSLALTGNILTERRRAADGTETVRKTECRTAAEVRFLLAERFGIRMDEKGERDDS